MAEINKSHAMYDVQPEFLSLVDRPANRRAFLLMKSEDKPDFQKFEVQAPFVKTETVGEVHYVTGVAYEPGVADTDDEYMTAEEVEKAAHYFMKSHGQIDKQHDWKADKNCDVVESWIATDDMTLNGQLVKAGTWLCKAEIRDSEIWEKITSGEIGGFSIGGYAKVAQDDTKAEKSDGLFERIVEYVKANFVQKGEVKERYDHDFKDRNLWAAHDALNTALREANWELTTDRDKIRDCLNDFNEIVTALLATDDQQLIKTATENQPTEKEETNMTNEQFDTLIATIKAMTPVQEPVKEEKAETLTAEDVKRMIADAMAEKKAEKPEEDKKEKSATMDDIMEMLKSMTPSSAADGMNEQTQQKSVEKSDNPYAGIPCFPTIM